MYAFITGPLHRNEATLTFALVYLTDSFASHSCICAPLAQAIQIVTLPVVHKACARLKYLISSVCASSNFDEGRLLIHRNMSSHFMTCIQMMGSTHSYVCAGKFQSLWRINLFLVFAMWPSNQCWEVELRSATLTTFLLEVPRLYRTLQCTL